MFTIDLMSRQPIYEQIINQLERFVLTGSLKPGEQVPSVRNLSVKLSINPNTIQKAYSELDRRGILYSVPGRGCFISDNAISLLSNLKRNQLSTLETMIHEFALAGIKKCTVLEVVEKAYSCIERSI